MPRICEARFLGIIVRIGLVGCSHAVFILYIGIIEREHYFRTTLYLVYGSNVSSFDRIVYWFSLFLRFLAVGIIVCEFPNWIWLVER